MTTTIGWQSDDLPTLLQGPWWHFSECCAWPSSVVSPGSKITIERDLDETNLTHVAIWHETKAMLCEDLPRTSCFASFYWVYCMNLYESLWYIPGICNAVMDVLILSGYLWISLDIYLPVNRCPSVSHPAGWPGFCEPSQSWWSLWRQALGNLKNLQYLEDDESLWFMMHVFNIFTVFRMFLECLLSAESWVVYLRIYERAM